MKSKIYIQMICLMLAASACSKDQLRTNRIDGTWNVTSVRELTTGGILSSSPDPEGSFSFDRCNLKKDGYCPYSQEMRYTMGGTAYTASSNGEYRFNEKGTVLELRESDTNGRLTVTPWYVLEFTHKRTQIERLADDGSKTIFTLERK